jgi:hypothetical protein
MTRSTGILETNIKRIELDNHVEYEPIDGSAKWFVDELDQLWVKFRADEDGVRTIVIAARTVVAVVYHMPK